MEGSQLVGPAGPSIKAPAAVSHFPSSMRQVIGALAVLVVLGSFGLYGRYYWTTGQFMVSTDDATVQADSVLISPKVSGYIAQVLVEDNQSVHAGEVLARIDDKDYQTALASARATLVADEADVGNLQAQIVEQRASVDQANAAVDADHAALTFSQQQSTRFATLARTGAGTDQNAQQWQADILEKQAAVARDNAGVNVATKQIDVLGSALAKAQALVAQQQATVHQAELNLGYTEIVAPVDGTVGDRTLRIGQYVQAGTQLMAIVPLSAVYVTANFKETQLTDVEPGQRVTMAVDTFPGESVGGVVNSVAPNSGEEFALLPPDNATGNFTKIVQRIPVKITFDRNGALSGRLRPGMSVVPTIDTRSSGE